MLTKRRIAVLIAGLESDAQQNLAAGMCECAIEKDYDLCFFNSLGATDSSVERFETSEKEIYSLPDLDTFDGIIVLYATINSRVARATVDELLSGNRRIPVASFDFPVENAINLTCDDRSSLMELMSHLVDDHHARRLGFVSGPADNAVAQNRLMTFRQFLRQRGIPLDSEDVFYGGFLYAGGVSAAEHFTRGGRRLPDAIVCANDAMALGLIEGLRHHGVQVPRDLLVTGVDRTDEGVNHNPSITSFFRPLRKCGYAIVDNIGKVILGDQPMDNVLLPTEIFIGQSCGCAGSDANEEKEQRGSIYRELQLSKHNLNQTSRLSNALSGTQSFDDLAGKLLDFVKSCELTEMYVCIDSERMQMARQIPTQTGETPHVERRKPKGYGKTMQMIFGYDHGISYPAIHFDTNLLLPLFETERPHSSQLVFCPLYYRDRNFGYVAFDVKQATGFILYAALVVLGGAMESLSLQATIQAYAKALEDSVIHDPMTGLLNRRGYLDVSRNYYQIALEQQQTLMIISGDVNGLKSINDRFGHMEGDFAIRLAAKSLSALQGETTSCIHISGDEFMVIGIDHTQQQMEEMIAQSKEALSRLSVISGKPYPVSLSLGGYIGVPDPQSSLEDFISQADDRMYIEKNEQKRRAALILAKSEQGEDKSLSQEIAAVQSAMREQSAKFMERRLFIGTAGLYQRSPAQQCFVSQKVLAFLGYTAKRYPSKAHGQFLDWVYPEDRERVLSVYAQLAVGGDVSEQRYRLVRQDGAIVWVLEQAMAFSLPDQSVVIGVALTDVGEEMRVQEEKSLLTQRLELIYQHIYSALFDYDIVGRVLTISEKARLVYGLPQIIHQPFPTLRQLEIVHPDSACELETLYQKAVSADAPVGCLIKLKQASGAYHLCRVSMTALYSLEREPLHVVGQVEALTGQKELERRYDEAVKRYRSPSFGVLASYIIDVTQDSSVKGNCFRSEIGDLCECDTLTELLAAATEKIPTQEERAVFLAAVSRDVMLKAYEDGTNLIRLQYRRRNRHRRALWVGLTVELLAHPDTGHVMAFVVIRDIDESKRRELAVTTRAENDLLTGLYTWETLQAMAQPLLYNREKDARYALLLVDIDHYHLVRDELGQRGAEQLLQETAALLGQLISGGDVACRVGGDLFAIFLCNQPTPEAALDFEQTLRARFADYTTPGGVKRPITVCTALCFANAEETSLERLYQRTRHELLLIKQQGANQSAMHVHASGGDSFDMRLSWREDYEGQPYLLIDPKTHRILECSDEAKKLLGYDGMLKEPLCHRLMGRDDAPCAPCPITELGQGTNLSASWLDVGGRRILLLGRMVERPEGCAYLETLLDTSDPDQTRDMARTRELMTDSLLLLTKAVERGEDRTEQLLSTLAYYYGASCAYVAECDATHHLGASYEYRPTGQASVSSLRDVPLGKLERWWQAYEARKQLSASDVERLKTAQPYEYELLTARGVTSFIAQPYAVKDLDSGFIVLENPTRHQGNQVILRYLTHLMELYWLFGSYEKRNHFLFYHDAMTGAYNRHRYLQYVSDSQFASLHTLGYLSIDVNNLKWLNENYGYLYGDELICRLSGILSRVFPDELIFRISGDLFHVLVEDVSYADFTRKVEQLRKLVREELSETVSLGCIWADSDIDPNSLGKNADELRIVNKREQSLQAEQNAEQQSKKSSQVFGESLRDKHCLLFLQPRIDLKTGMLAGAEALARMEHPRFGLISPAKFIPLMERENTIALLDSYMLEQAAEQLGEWKRRGAPLMPISVNLSPKTLMEDGLISRLQMLRRKYADISDGMIELELYEDAGGASRAQLTRVCEELSAYGYAINLDQFGVKSADMTMLTSLHYRGVKLGRKLFAGCDQDPAVRALLKSVIAICRELGMASIAVGVETECEMHALKELDCDMAQGFLFGKPMPAAEFVKRYIG